MAAFKINNKKPNPQKLIKYGFKKNTKHKSFEYKTLILNKEFELSVTVSLDGTITTKLTECTTNELYTLHLSNAQGDFVGAIREEYQKIITEISKNCFDLDVFKSTATKNIIEFIEKKYGDYPEYLWEKFPRNAVFRKKSTKKWYAAILSTSLNKFHGKSKEIVELIDLHIPEEMMENLLKNSYIYPGYHMNKKHWITILLDGSIDENKIFELIDISYKMA